MNILLLGSTGSIGKNACNCIRRHPDHFRLAGIGAKGSVDTLLSQLREFSPSYVYVASERAAREVKGSLPSSVTFYEGPAGLEQIVNEADYDVLLNALVGAVGFRPTVAALRRGKKVALANKESLVIGGDVIRPILESGTGRLVPVDSEHSAILQCLQGENASSIEQLILTASGGPFRQRPVAEFASITAKEALDHPTWSMGPKITVDAGTLINKGFEIIEAHHLFRLPYDSLSVVIHPQSIVHSMVVFHDGAVMAQCGIPDMELPIQYALSYPHRLPLAGKRLHLPQIGSLTFSEPDLDRFPCLRLCIESGRQGGTLPAVLNAANEIAVACFLAGRIRFDQIATVVEEALQRHVNQAADSVETVEQVDRETREQVRDALSCIGKS